MPTTEAHIWRLALSGEPIDANELSSALEEQADDERPDFRTCLLIRDALEALSAHWGQDRLTAWLELSPKRRHLHRIHGFDLGPAGFPSLVHRIMDATRPETIRQFFRDLGSQVSGPARLNVGGSSSLILAGTLSRHTEDIDVVDEVPSSIRGKYDLLEQLAKSYGLTLAHFQSHYLPAGWSNRVRSLGRFGQLDVFLVDVYDVLLSKLFSTRRKDLDDLRAAAPRIDKQVFETRLKQSAGPLLGEPDLAQNARRNWYVVYGEPLPAL